jgi:hypothetical protein
MSRILQTAISIGYFPATYPINYIKYFLHRIPL